jgi:two-component system CheB/CheR fusion protein
LQSINEELLTVNQESKSKIDELSQLTNDLQNLLASTDIATLFLDRELRIKRFTPRISDLFNVLGGDRGRPLAHITHKLNYDTLLPDATGVLQTLAPIERETQSQDGRWYIIRILPYRTADDRIDGVVITLVDITQHRRAAGDGG